MSLPRRAAAAAGIYVRGLCMGAADVVPGVSGGTMAFILGIYTRLIDAIRRFDITLLRFAASGQWGQAWRRTSPEFLLPLMAGIVSAIIFFTRVVPLPALLHSNPTEIYGLFFGLVGGSVAVLLRHLGGLRVGDLPLLCAGLLLGAAIVTAVPTETPETWWFVAFSGSLAICAMVLPGISGSFVLLLLGKYAYVIDALGHLRFEVIAPFIAGAGIGLLLFVRLLSWLLHHFERACVVAICGILVASLWILWPFQERTYVVVREKARLIGSSPIAPQFDHAGLTAIALMAAGLVLVVMIEMLSRRFGRD